MLADLAAQTPLPGNVLVGLTPRDDAAVVGLDAERALIATVDFFPPIVDDPADYGAIAAANAVSDIYAMGGKVAFALAVSGFPESVPREIVLAVARAARDVVNDCGGVVLGGHSIRCAEPVFGLCVIGFAHPARFWRKAGAKPGDRLVLSKPLGTGLLVSADVPAGVATAVAAMRVTNRRAAAELEKLVIPPRAVTDVSGYGLIGHAREVAEQSGVVLRIVAERVPLLPGALAAARAGVRTTAHRGTQAPLAALLDDPQTSGGLLAAVAPESVAALLAAGYAEIGEVVAGQAAVAVV